MTAVLLARRRVVLVPFPFSDLSATKLRPALVLAEAGRGDWVLCQITSQPYTDAKAAEIHDTDFADGGLKLTSYVRPGKLLTTYESLIRPVAGELSAPAHQRVLAAVVAMLVDG